MDLAARFAEAATYHRAGRLTEAEAAYRAVLAEAPGHLGTLSNLGSLLRALDRVDEAEAPLLAAVAAAPRDDPRPRVNLANLYRWTARWADAEALYDALIAGGHGTPDLLLDASTVYLARGRYAEGWRLQDARPNAQIRRGQGIGSPEWRGEPLAGRSVLVLPEQGFGDQLLAARFLPALKAAGAGRVTVLCQAPLVRIFEAMPAVDVAIACAPEDAISVGRHDCWTLPFSLPRWLQGERPPPTPPYLAAPAGVAADPGARVGFVWHGGRHQPVERHRGLPSPDLLEPLVALAPMVDLQEPRGDFAVTAALLERLDLVITTDTAMANLAGALGRRAFVMLPYVGMDWRWGDGRRTPWFPTLRLYRQPAPGDWGSVIAAMAADLATSAAAEPPPGT